MTVILVLLTFLAFAIIDYAINRGKFPRRVVEKPHTRAHNAVFEPARAGIMEPAVTWVDGFSVPDRMRYHPGHAWCLTERKGVERVGVDDFAARLPAASTPSNCLAAANGCARVRRRGRSPGTARKPRWLLRLRAKCCK